MLLSMLTFTHPVRGLAWINYKSQFWGDPDPDPSERVADGRGRIGFGSGVFLLLVLSIMPLSFSYAAVNPAKEAKEADVPTATDAKTEEAITGDIMVLVRHIDSPRRARILESVLVAELNKFLDIRGLPASTAQPVQNATCADDCMALVRKALGGRWFLAAKVQVVGSTELLTLKLLHPESLEVRGMVTRSVALREGVLPVLGSAVQELLQPAQMREDMMGGVDIALNARWRPQPIPSWGFFAVTGATAAAVLSTVVFAALTGSAQKKFDTLSAGGTAGEPIDGAEYMATIDRTRSLASTTNIMIGTSLSLAAASAVAFFFTDFGNDAAITPILGGASTAQTGLQFSLRF